MGVAGCVQAVCCMCMFFSGPSEENGIRRLASAPNNDGWKWIARTDEEMQQYACVNAEVLLIFRIFRKRLLWLGTSYLIPNP